MDRKKLLEYALQRGHLLALKNQWYEDYIRTKIIPLISEDFVKGDITTDLIINKDFSANASVISKQNGVIAGIEEAGFLYSLFGIDIIESVKDGSIIKPGDVILKLKGSIKALLKTERKILDLISRMSGIATMASNLRKLVKDKIAIAATRKTLLPYLDKKAVFIGGGLTHRLALWDGILVKDNHLQKKFSLENFFSQVIKRGHKVIEVEVRNQQTALEIFSAFKRYKQTKYDSKAKLILIIMFDNMKPSYIKNTIYKILRACGSENFVDNLLFEASGNITEKNIKEYINTGIDFVSLGMLTHSVKGFDLTQKII